ncbi:hypothetical protein [Zobellia alginiliquefaciens]|uniref:hypothetical protein n=1 Tax=Zobellia alginiliquefaciens TaxID=3032586 RepID=UPI0023E3B54D|nr:hypothetical protein [Zobellia alginiliquefaciens]
MQKSVVFTPDHSLALNPHSLRRVYGVTIDFEKTGEPRQTLRFEIEVLAKKVKEKNSWMFQFDRRHLYINEENPDTISEKLAFECGQIIYPLQIQVSSNWATKVIKSRPLAIKQLNTLENETKLLYKSSMIDRYFSKAYDSVNHPEKYLRAVEQNLFLSFFFAPLYQQYNRLTNSATTIMNIPIVPFCSPIEYTLEQKVSPKYTRFNTITVTQQGKITDSRTQKDISHKLNEPVFTGKGQSKKLEGELIAKYELHKETNVLHSLTAEADINLEKDKKLAFQIQAYYLVNRDKIAAQSDFITIPKLKPSKNG